MGRPMYVDISNLHRNGRTYQRVLLRESFRDHGKVKKRTIANISRCTADEIRAIQLALQFKNDLAHVDQTDALLSIRQGLSVGAVCLVYQLACRLGIAAALGNSREGKLALWQVIARVIDQGSRLSAVRLAGHHAACDVLGLGAFHEEHLYENLDWLEQQQTKIEQRLFRKKHRGNKPDLFLYDVTSSYLEGQHNELAAFGYNRDRKRGKKQIVIGLLCDHTGTPLSVEVFRGNTQDTKTFGSQVVKVAARFGGGTVTFVGDRGMIKGPQIEELAQYKEHDFHYITAITKPQIEKLIKEGQIQMGLFDQTLAEITEPAGIRYVLRRNPERSLQIKQSRKEKYVAVEQVVQERNQYLQEHPRAKTAVALRLAQAKAKQLKIDDWVIVEAKERTLRVEKDQEPLKQVEKLDGCYVLKTDLSAELAPKETVHDRYKDLATVEWAFRTCKTSHLEMRPIHVRLARRTRAHVFVVMMSYWISKELSSLWQSFDLTVEEGIDELKSLCMMEIKIADDKFVGRIPEPRELGKKLLDSANVKLPVSLPNTGIEVATKKKLPSRRKVV